MTDLSFHGRLLAKYPVQRLKFLIRSNDGGFWGDEPDGGPNDRIVLRSTEQALGGRWAIVDPAVRQIEEREYRTRRLLTGDIVVTKSSGSSDHIGKCSVVTKDIEELECTYSNFMQRLRPHDSSDSRYLAYVLNNDIGREQFRLHSTTTTGLGNLSQEILGDILVPSPPGEVQHHIADYLDAETAEIDALIAEKARMLALLEEQRAAVVTHAVTRRTRSRCAAEAIGPGMAWRNTATLAQHAVQAFWPNRQWFNAEPRQTRILGRRRLSLVEQFGSRRPDGSRGIPLRYGDRVARMPFTQD